MAGTIIPLRNFKLLRYALLSVYHNLFKYKSAKACFPHFLYPTPSTSILSMATDGNSSNLRPPHDGQQKDKKSLYEIFGVERTASHQEIKKAYYKLALQLHPDKNPGDEVAKEKFQQLQKAISILADEEKRAIYDQTGCVDDADLAGETIQNLHEYFRAMYKKVTDVDIEEFEANYRGSDSEKSDLLDLYVKCKGNMNMLFCSMLCSEPKFDSHRFKDIIDDAIAKGKVKSTKAYQKWAHQVSQTKPPIEPLRKRGKSDKQSQDLFAIISQRQSERKDKFESMFSSLMNKYGGGEPVPEPSEEEFEAARRKIEIRKLVRKSNRK